MDFLVELLKRIFPHVTDVEIDNCKGIVEFLLKQGLVKKVALSKIMKFYLRQKFFCLAQRAYNILTNQYLSVVMNSYNLSRFMLQNYSQVQMYSQSSAIQNYVLYPVLIEIVKHKAVVLIILAFI